jgi:hypothetical protein
MQVETNRWQVSVPPNTISPKFSTGASDIVAHTSSQSRPPESMHIEETNASAYYLMSMSV